MSPPEVPVFARQRIDSLDVLEVSKEVDVFDDDDKLFLLERRAIFSKTWICVAHRSRFTKPGDYVAMELATFPIFIILGKDNIARAFHNVCRHRAYTVTKKTAGSSLVLGCKYHGWSYDTKGKLLKAPQFDGIDGFDKTQNSLFAIHTCTDKGGFIHVNLDAGLNLEPPSCASVVAFAAEHGIHARGSWITGWDLKGDFNWKVAAQQPISTLALQEAPSASSAAAAGLRAYLRLLVGSARKSAPKGANAGGSETPTSLNVSPITTLKMLPGSSLWLCITAFPLSAARTAVRCDVYSAASSFAPAPSQAQLEQLEQGVAAWVRGLESSYVVVESGPLSKQNEFLPMLREHLREERMRGVEIMPGSRREGRSVEFMKGEQVCKELEDLAGGGMPTACAVGGDGEKGGMEW
ncbi:ISP domain-containing protein [Lophium mytilinum]|uniref:ISP domain-containing protein n=1 Tax=Lophium mytilinum TaxID=390894 RepID=A0A6A6QFM5_9PEZI|nr:ISP domain-containing protein [Lophium mytilinum]